MMLRIEHLLLFLFLSYLELDLFCHAHSHVLGETLAYAAIG